MQVTLGGAETQDQLLPLKLTNCSLAGSSTSTTVMVPLAGADNRHLAGVPHVQMADRPEPWAELERWLVLETRP